MIGHGNRAQAKTDPVRRQESLLNNAEKFTPQNRFNYQQIHCPRCRYNVKEALLSDLVREANKQSGQIQVDYNDVICEHCRKQVRLSKVCSRCENEFTQFISKRRTSPDETKKRLKTWLSKVQRELKDILTNSKDVGVGAIALNNRIFSETYLGNLHGRLHPPIFPRKPHVSKLLDSNYKIQDPNALIPFDGTVRKGKHVSETQRPATASSMPDLGEFCQIPEFTVNTTKIIDSEDRGIAGPSSDHSDLFGDVKLHQHEYKKTPKKADKITEFRTAGKDLKGSTDKLKKEMHDKSPPEKNTKVDEHKNIADTDKKSKEKSKKDLDSPKYQAKDGLGFVKIKEPKDKPKEEVDINKVGKQISEQNYSKLKETKRQEKIIIETKQSETVEKRTTDKGGKGDIANKQTPKDKEHVYKKAAQKSDGITDKDIKKPADKTKKDTHDENATAKSKKDNEKSALTDIIGKKNLKKEFESNKGEKVNEQEERAKKQISKSKEPESKKTGRMSDNVTNEIIDNKDLKGTTDEPKKEIKDKSASENIAKVQAYDKSGLSELLGKKNFKKDLEIEKTEKGKEQGDSQQLPKGKDYESKKKGRKKYHVTDDKDQDKDPQTDSKSKKKSKKDLDSPETKKTETDEKKDADKVEKEPELSPKSKELAAQRARENAEFLMKIKQAKLEKQIEREARLAEVQRLADLKKIADSKPPPKLKAIKAHKQTKVTNIISPTDRIFDALNITDRQEKVMKIIVGHKILNKRTSPRMATEENSKQLPILFKAATVLEVGIDKAKGDAIPHAAKPETVESEAKIPDHKVKVNLKSEDSKSNGSKVEPESHAGITRYALSDRTYIDKGWTQLPTEKVVRKMNVYRMRPAHPEFDWFARNKNRRLVDYDTGEKLAEIDDNGRGRWYYRNGKLALDYYDAEELNAQQRFVLYSSGEPDERGRSQPFTILGMFDYLGNGVVFDHTGKIRLKYNQTEGVVLDRSLGPVSHWKWHSLNDPPVLQQVMIDTQMPQKDPDIAKLGGPTDKKARQDNEDMLAIEFDNFIKEKSKKLTQKFKPFQIKMKALKINEHFSLKVLDQASIYLIFRDGSTNLKLNMGMILDHQEIVDTDTAEVGEVSNSMERQPARTDSLAALQSGVAQAQRMARVREAHERRLRPVAAPCASAERLTAALSRPLRKPLLTAQGDASSAEADAQKTPFEIAQRRCLARKPSRNNIYYDSRLM